MKLNIIDTMRAIPQYAKDHLPEMAVFASVGGTTSAVALKYFGRLEAVGAAALVSLAYYYRDKISTVYQAAISPHFLTLVGAIASLPFIASVPVIGTKLAISLAGYISFALLRYEMEQKSTIKYLEGLNGKLTENNKELDARVKGYDQITASAKEVLESQISNNGSLTNLHTKMVRNTSKLEAIVAEDETITAHLNRVLQLVCELFSQVKQDDLAKDIIDAGSLVQRVQTADTKLTGLEKKVDQGLEALSDVDSRLAQAAQKLATLKQKTSQQDDQGDKR